MLTKQLVVFVFSVLFSVKTQTTHVSEVNRVVLYIMGKLGTKVYNNRGVMRGRFLF